MMMSTGGASLSLCQQYTHAYLLQRRVQALALLHLCCAIGRGRGGAHGVLWCGRRVLGFLPSCFVGVQERREVAGSRAFERLQSSKRWPVAWMGMRMSVWEVVVVGYGGLQDAQMQQ